MSIFVKSNDNRLGIGKLVSRDGEVGTVEYFDSPANDEPNSIETPVDKLKHYRLEPQTRVYYRNPDTFAFEIGRVLDYQEEDKVYLVRFPNEVRRMIAESELSTRCSKQIQDPTEHLALQLNETAFWHQGRAEFVRHVLSQKCDSQGLSALTSSSLDLVPHQAAVVRKVLRDPFQRYLLADEVGLGKTIEAGALIKQYCMDEPEVARVLVVVPRALVNQWQQELSFRFHLDELLGQTVFVVASDDLAQVQKFGARAGMIVVDEAHHLASWAWSKNENEKRLFDAVQYATTAIEKRVLLLSATPVLHNERAFLAMLHLLDPQVYKLNEIAAFRTRVEKRQEVAESMLSLTESESNFFLEQSLEDLAGFLSGDVEFDKLKTGLMTLIEKDVDEDDPERIALIKALRSHVSDTWRLHRRILRNRRTETTSCYLPGRAGVTKSTYSSQYESGVEEALDEWRLSVSTESNSWDEAKLDSVVRLCKDFYEAAFTDPGLLERLAKKRASDSAELIGDESELLEQIVRAAKRCTQKARLNQLCSEIARRPEETSFIVFASEQETADLVFGFAEKHLADRLVLRHSTENMKWAEFKNGHKKGVVLVCDREAEEGLNLQKRGAIAIHYDLPLSPNRIEQRMGRLDRFGSGSPVASIFLADSQVSFQRSWFDLVNTGLDVFGSSIASLQYIVDKEIKSLWRDFIHSGCEAIDNVANRLGGDEGLVVSENRKLRAQDEIDSFDEDAQSVETFEKMERADLEIARLSPAVLDRWLVSRLHFQKRGEESRGDSVFSYCFTRRNDFGKGPGKKAKDTLLPFNDFANRFAHSIDEIQTREPVVRKTVPLAFDRVVAQRREARLVRFGDPFVNSLEELTRWDDRGVCFAFWRHQRGYQASEGADVFFRFDFVLEANQAYLTKLLEQFPSAKLSAMARRTTELFPPKFVTLWLDNGLETVSDPTLKECLKVPFSKTSSQTGNDYNLNPRRWNQASQVYDLSNWNSLCFAARRAAEEIFHNHEGVKRLTASIAEQANVEANRHIQQFTSRIAIATHNDKTALEDERQFELQFAEVQRDAILNPSLKVDSVGSVLLSGEMPFVEPPPEDEY